MQKNIGLKKRGEILIKRNCRNRSWKFGRLSQTKVPGNIQKEFKEEKYRLNSFFNKNELVLWTGLRLLSSLIKIQLFCEFCYSKHNCEFVQRNQKKLFSTINDDFIYRSGEKRLVFEKNRKQFSKFRKIMKLGLFSCYQVATVMTDLS